MNLKNYYDKSWERTKQRGGADYSDNVSRKRIETVIEWIGKEKKVLDYGSADGKLTSIIRQRCESQVVGVDVSSLAVELAQTNYPEMAFQVVEDGERLPFPDGHFDVVFAGEVIEHLLDVERVLDEFNRVSKVGGALILTTPYHGVAKNLAIALTGFSKHFNPRGEHIRFFTLNSLRDLLRDTGFAVQEVKFRGRIFPFSSGMMVRAEKRKSVLDRASPASADRGDVRCEGTGQ